MADRERAQRCEVLRAEAIELMARVSALAAVAEVLELKDVETEAHEAGMRLASAVSALRRHRKRWEE
jgi:hypothetical protein